MNGTKNTMKDKRLAIIGYGFVGKATDYGFPIKTKKLFVDPKLNTQIDSLKDFDPEIIFICLPTPMKDDGSQDNKLILSTLREIKEMGFRGTTVIKSTVLPSLLDEASKIIENLVYNPEFLREKFAEEDFVNSPMVILGGNQKDTKLVKDFYKNHSICETKNFIFTDLKSASLIKYSINSFLANKVIFFNGIKQIFDHIDSNISWNEFANIISIDERIGSSHMMVPGHDGKLGFGGACFTKDTAALINYAQLINEGFELLESTVKINNKIRSDYDELDEREKEQNVNYNFKN
tara:strand:+ start:988 stop:1863 length:876 start_codon:yes stop_codon:yes gene_type:complete